MKPKSFQEQNQWKFKLLKFIGRLLGLKISAIIYHHRHEHQRLED